MTQVERDTQKQNLNGLRALHTHTKIGQIETSSASSINSEKLQSRRPALTPISSESYSIEMTVDCQSINYKN